MTAHETPDPQGPNFTGGPVMRTGETREMAREGVEALAEELCRYDDSLHHMEGTDDFPCWHCKAKAAAVLDTDWLAEHDAKVKAEALLEADEIDRNARAYGWSVGRGHPLVEQIEDVDPANPFLDPNWRDRLGGGSDE